MSIRRLIYSSRVGRQVRFADAEAIAEAAAERNLRASLTGLLLYTPSHFVQVLEGERAAVDETFLRIRADSRHTRVVIIDDREVPSREFPAWGMKAHFCPAPSSALEVLNVDTAIALLREARDEAKS